MLPAAVPARTVPQPLQMSESRTPETSDWINLRVRMGALSCGLRSGGVVVIVLSARQPFKAAHEKSEACHHQRSKRQEGVK
jgi:hypothetical protein